MARLNPFTERPVAFKDLYLGKILLFCEGCTEKNYFNYFANIINKNQTKYSHIKIIPVLAGGNAQRVLNFAKEYLSHYNQEQKFSLYNKYLIFDCDAPPDIAKVINDMKKLNDFSLLPSNCSFDIWLLMHFENVYAPLSKKEIFSKLAVALKIKSFDTKSKSSEGIMRKVIEHGDIKKAIENAKRLEQKYQNQHYLFEKDIQNMNPYTTVHNLIEQILIEINYIH